MTRTLQKALLSAILLFSTAQCFAADVTLYLTRHGKTMFNTVHRAQGWSDTPLTQAGVDVAQKLGRGLKPVEFIAVWSSDSGRARETAQLVMENRKPLPLNERKALREVGFGIFEGGINNDMLAAAAKQLGYSSAASIEKGTAEGKLSYAQIIDAIHKADSSGTAETYQQVATRVTGVVKEIAQQAQQQGGGNVLVVSHGLAILTLLAELGSDYRQQLSNASVTRIRYTDAGKFIIESVNDMSYVQRGS